MHAERRLGKSGDVWSAVIQRRSDPGNGAKTTIRTGLIGIRLEQSQEAGLSGDSGELSFNGNHWETLPCAQSIKTRLMPSYCVALDTAFMPTPRQKKVLVECKETLAIVAACRETEASMNTTLLPTTAAAHGQAGNQPHTAQCQRCNVTLYRPYVAGAFQPITKTHCPACEEYLALVAVAKAASQFERAAAAMTHTSDFLPGDKQRTYHAAYISIGLANRALAAIQHTQDITVLQEAGITEATLAAKLPANYPKHPGETFYNDTCAG